MWGANDIHLICNAEDKQKSQPIYSATFKKDGVKIDISNADGCTPSGSQYCYAHDGELLYFIANSETEGRYTCENEDQTMSNKVAIIGKCIVSLVCNVCLCTLCLSFAVINAWCPPCSLP